MVTVARIHLQSLRENTVESSPPDFSHLREIEPPNRGNESEEESPYAMRALLEHEQQFHRLAAGSDIADWLALNARQEQQLRAVIEINQAHSSAIDLALGHSSVIEGIQRFHGRDGPLDQIQHLREAEDRIQALRDVTRRFDPEVILGSLGIYSEAFDRHSPTISIPDWMVNGPRTARQAIKEAVQEAMRDVQPTTKLPPPKHERLSTTPCSPAVEPTTKPPAGKTPPTTTTPSADRSCDFRLSRVSEIEAPAADRDRGIISYISCIVNDALRIDGVALRRTLEGEYSVSFPKKPGRSIDQHYYFKPINEAMRQEFLRQILVALGRDR
jgi:hypothetical protein